MRPLLAAFGLSGGELLLVLTAVLILFGAKKIPEFAKGLGQGIKEFKKASREVQDEIERAAEDLNSAPPPPPPPSVEPQQSEDQHQKAVASSGEDAPPPAPPAA